MKKKINGIIIMMLTLIVACCMVSCTDNNNNTVIEPKNVIKVRGCESVDEIFYGMTYFDYFGKASFNTDKAKVHSGEGSLKLQPQGAVGWEYKDYAENIKKVRPFFTITGAMKSQPKWAFGDTGNYVTSIDGYFYNDTDANVPLYVYVTYQTDKGNITRNLKTAGETSELTGNKDVNIESLASKQWQKISYNTMPDVSKLINAGYAVSGVATVSYMFNPVEDDAAVPTIYVDDFALNISRAPTISVGKTPASIFVGDEVILDITSTTKDATLETKVTLNDKPIIVTDNKFISEAAGESYKVTVKATSKENESISIVRNIKTNGKFHGVIDFDDKVAPVGFTPVPVSGTECNAKVTYSKDFGYESSYSLKMNAGNVSGVSNVLEITNTEFIENIKTFDYFTFMMISNNPYPGEIKIDSPDTTLGFDGTYQSVVEWTQFKIPTSAFYSIYGENFTKVRIYIAAVDATATSWYAYLDDFRFGFDEETSVIVSSSNYVGIKGDYTTTIQLKKDGVIVDNLIDSNFMFTPAQIGNYELNYTVNGATLSKATTYTRRFNVDYPKYDVSKITDIVIKVAAGNVDLTIIDSSIANFNAKVDKIVNLATSEEISYINGANGGSYLVSYTITGDSIAATMHDRKITIYKDSFRFTSAELPEGFITSNDSGSVTGLPVIETDGKEGFYLKRTAGIGCLKITNAELLAKLYSCESLTISFGTSINAEMSFYSTTLGIIGTPTLLVRGETTVVTFTKAQLLSMHGISQLSELTEIRLYYTGTDSSNPANNFTINYFEFN